MQNHACVPSTNELQKKATSGFSLVPWNSRLYPRQPYRKNQFCIQLASILYQATCKHLVSDGGIFTSGHSANENTSAPTWQLLQRVSKKLKKKLQKEPPKWSPNRAQIDEHGAQKQSQKKHQQMIPKKSSNWSPRGSQNRAKSIKNEVSETSCFKAGTQVASRQPPGSILKRFGDHVGNNFTILCIHVV